MESTMPVDDEAPSGWGLLAQIPLRLSVEIGSVSRTMSELLAMRRDSVIELDRPVDAPVDVLANGRVIARGDVVNAGERFGVKITEIVDPEPSAAQRERRG